MSSEPVRDPIGGPLLTPANCALILIDYQPIQVSSVGSMDRELLVDNVVRVARIARTYRLPVVLSTVNVATGRNQPTISRLRDVLADVVSIDRTGMNAWEDREFVAAVRATGRRKLVMCALWTEMCLAFPALDAMREGYDVYPVVDAIGGTSLESHRAGLERIYQAGAVPVSWTQLICELQRDYARTQTVAAFVDILFDPHVPFVTAEHR
jgi:nicotinamidase-related amidase